MTRRQKLAVLATVVAAVIGLFVRMIPDRVQEPVHEGKRLGDWMDIYYNSGGTERERSAVAIRAIGSEAIPFLLQEIGCKDSALKLRFLDLVSRVTRGAMRPRSAETRHRKAAAAFSLLGDKAKSAVPSLARILTTPARNADVIELLYHLGSPAETVLPAIVGCYAGEGSSGDEARRLRKAAFRFSQAFDHDQLETVLIDALKDPNHSGLSMVTNVLIRVEAARARARDVRPLDARSDAFVLSVLDDCFHGPTNPERYLAAEALVRMSPFPEVRRQAILTLSRVGTSRYNLESLQAILTPSLQDIDTGVREAGTNALDQLGAVFSGIR